MTYKQTTIRLQLDLSTKQKQEDIVAYTKCWEKIAVNQNCVPRI